MGLPDNLFKSPPKEKPEIVETGKIAEGPAADRLARAEPACEPTLASEGLPAANASLRTANDGAPHDVPKVPSPRSAARAEIVLTLGEVLSRIPTQFLRPGMHDAERELHLRIADVSGANTERPTVALPRIALQCPSVFNTGAEGFTDVQISLPVETVRKQLGANPSGGQTHELGSAMRVAAGEALETSERLELSLAAVLKRCPGEMIIGDLPQLDEDARITLPLAPIAQQLPTGKVEISALEFIAALPSAVRESFRAVDGLKVALPLQEILEKLSPQPQSPLTATAQSPEIGVRNGNSSGVEERPFPATRSGFDTAPGGWIAPNPTHMPPPRVRPVLVPPPVLPYSPTASRNAQEMWQLAATMVALPGLQACIIGARGELAHAGELPEGIDPGKIRTLATLLASALRGAPGTSLSGVREIALPGHAFSLVFFLTADVAITAVTRGRSLVEGVAERLLDAAAELSIMRA